MRSPLGDQVVDESARLRLGRRHQHRRGHGPLDRGGIAPDRLAVALEHLGLAAEPFQTKLELVGHVGVSGGDLQRALLATTANQDPRPVGLDRPWLVERPLDPVAAAVE
jgi:hypothetical protein